MAAVVALGLMMLLDVAVLQLLRFANIAASFASSASAGRIQIGSGNFEFAVVA